MSNESKSSSLSVVSDSLQPHGLEPASLLCPWNSPGKNTGVGCHALLQGIFPTQGTEPGSPALQADSLPSEPPRSNTVRRASRSKEKKGLFYEYWNDWIAI